MTQALLRSSTVTQLPSPKQHPKATSANGRNNDFTPEKGQGVAGFCFLCSSPSAALGLWWQQVTGTTAHQNTFYRGLTLKQAEAAVGTQNQRLKLLVAALPPQLPETQRGSRDLSGSGGPTRPVTAESQQRACVFCLRDPAWDNTDNTIYLSSPQLGDCWMTDTIHGEHHCIDPDLPLEEIQMHTENSELPRKFKISNLHETNLQQLHFEGTPGMCFDPKQKSATSND